MYRASALETPSTPGFGVMGMERFSPAMTNMILMIVHLTHTQSKMLTVKTWDV
jgi:hypothetical protein